MPRIKERKLINRTFEEVTEGIFNKAEEYGYPRHIVKAARKIVKLLKRVTGSREIMAVASLYVACRIHDFHETQEGLEHKFGHTSVSIRKYVNMIIPDIDYRGTWLENTKKGRSRWIGFNHSPYGYDMVNRR